MNAAKAELERIAGTLGPSDFPKKFAIELCADCNLNCVMCHHDQMQRPKGVMPMALWQKCADEIAEVRPETEVWISFCGEPLLEPQHLVDVIRYGRSVGLKSINVNTNGMLLTEEWFEPLLDAGPHKIVFGVDGFTAESYEAIRVNGKRDVLYANIEGLLRARQAREEGPDILVQYIFMDENEGEFETFRDYWLERGAIVKARRQLSWGGRFETGLDIAHEHRIPCPWAITMMHVFWDGRVPRCPGDTEGTEGADNAWHHSLVDLWADLGRYRTLHLERRFDELPERCQTCTDWMTGAAERIRPKRVPA